ncbi:hypothetical protein ACM55M_16795 [Flavobacterium sp. ZT3R25]|uniref:hypothetical protein n=1 Tax=Flavobacterium galactosi TaxID=3398735 RepID=UPI003A849A7B
MKSKLYIAGIVSLSFLTYSCSSDDESYDVQEVKTKNFQITPQAVLNAKTIDSTTVKSGPKISTTRLSEEDGDPNNPIPPR